MHKLFLSLRYLRKRRLAFFGIAAVALCVALLIVITSLFNGFIRSLHTYWQQSWGQVVLAPNHPMHDFEALTERLEEIEGVSRATALISSGALLYLGRGDVRGVELHGVDPANLARDKNYRSSLLLRNTIDTPPGFSLSDREKDKAVAWFKQKFKRPPDDKDMPCGVIVGIGILAEPDEMTDQYDHSAVVESLQQREVPLTLITGSFTAPSDVQEPRMKKISKTCWPVDVIQTGIHQADTRYVYLPLDYMRDLIGTQGPDGRKQCLGRIRIYVESESELSDITDRVRRTWSVFARDVMDWPDERIGRAGIFESMKMPNLRLITSEIHKQLAIMQLIIGLICIVASLLIFVILFMIVMRKRKDIGIIRSLGSSRWQVATLFISYGACIGLLGTSAGLALGIWATHNISLIEKTMAGLLGFKIWKSGVYMFSNIPNEVDTSALAWIVITGFATAVLGALLPAIRAARLQPVDAIRYE